MKHFLRIASYAFMLLWFGCTSDNDSRPEQQAASANWFSEESRSRGIDFVHVSGAQGEYFLPEIMGSGVALLDIENDGDLDVYFVQSGNIGQTFDDQSNPNALFQNDGSGHFSQIHGGDATSTLGYGMGVSVADYNNDGYEDIYITNVGPNVLLENQGDGTFNDVTDAAGVGEQGWGTSSAFMDFDVDGDLDLFVVNYIRWSKGIELECYHTTLGSRDYCGPALYRASAQDRLFENNGDGSFRDATLEAGLLNVVGNGLGVVVADFNEDSLPDIFVANDISPNHLWINKGDLKFVEECVPRGCAADEHGSIKAGMGVVAEDIDNDLDNDILVVNLVAETDTLFRNEKDFFIDVTSLVGLSNASQRYTRFGLAMTDFNNDGHFDIYHANGAIFKSLETHVSDPYAEPDVTFRGEVTGRFNARPEKFPSYTSRGLATGDIDLDGDIDVVVVNREQRASLYLNEQDTGNNWVQLDIRNDNGSTALGAIVRFEVDGHQFERTVQNSGSYLSARSPVVHIGLGNLQAIEGVKVTWLNGESQMRPVLNAGRRFVISSNQEP